jgi:hypothetical protein
MPVKSGTYILLAYFTAWKILSFTRQAGNTYKSVKIIGIIRYYDHDHESILLII